MSATRRPIRSANGFSPDTSYLVHLPDVRTYSSFSGDSGPANGSTHGLSWVRMVSPSGPDSQNSVPPLPNVISTAPSFAPDTMSSPTWYRSLLTRETVSPTYVAMSSSATPPTSLHRRSAVEPAVVDATLEDRDKRTVALGHHHVVPLAEEVVVRGAAAVRVPRPLPDLVGILRDLVDMPLQPRPVGRIGRVKAVVPGVLADLGAELAVVGLQLGRALRPGRLVRGLLLGLLQFLLDGAVHVRRRRLGRLDIGHGLGRGLQVDGHIGGDGLADVGRDRGLELLHDRPGDGGDLGGVGRTRAGIRAAERERREQDADDGGQCHRDAGLGQCRLQVAARVVDGLGVGVARLRDAVAGVVQDAEDGLLVTGFRQRVPERRHRLQALGVVVRGDALYRAVQGLGDAVDAVPRRTPGGGR